MIFRTIFFLGTFLEEDEGGGVMRMGGEAGVFFFLFFFFLGWVVRGGVGGGRGGEEVGGAGDGRGGGGAEGGGGSSSRRAARTASCVDRWPTPWTKFRRTVLIRSATCLSVKGNGFPPAFSTNFSLGVSSSTSAPSSISSIGRKQTSSFQSPSFNALSMFWVKVTKVLYRFE